MLKHLGPKALPGIPHLITAGLGYRGQSGSPKRAAERALKELGPVAVPDLVRALRGNDRVLRRKAVHVLGMIGPEASASVPAGGAARRERRAPRRNCGVRTWEDWPRGGEAIPALEQRLRAPEIRTRVQAADILRRIDPNARQVISVLRAALEGDDPPSRSQAITTLGSMGPQAVPLLERVLRESKHPLEGPAIYRALAAIDPEPEVARFAAHRHARGQRSRRPPRGTEDRPGHRPRGEGMPSRRGTNPGGQRLPGQTRRRAHPRRHGRGQHAFDFAPAEALVERSRVGREAKGSRSAGPLRREGQEVPYRPCGVVWTPRIGN